MLSKIWTVVSPIRVRFLKAEPLKISNSDTPASGASDELLISPIPVLRPLSLAPKKHVAVKLAFEVHGPLKIHLVDEHTVISKAGNPKYFRTLKTPFLVHRKLFHSLKRLFFGKLVRLPRQRSIYES